MAKKEYLIPFDEDGNQVHYPESWRKPTFKPNYEFADALEYKTYHRGRSAAYFEFQSITTGKKFTMFMTDFNDIVPRLVKGMISGTFTFTKRGQNYGVKRV